MNARSEHHRRSLRLKGYDYSQAGAYFITICTHKRACILGDVVDGQIHLHTCGQWVKEQWTKLPDRFPGVMLDEFVIMPNHMHGILHLVVGAIHCAHISQYRCTKSQCDKSGRDKSCPYNKKTLPDTRQVRANEKTPFAAG